MSAPYLILSGITHAAHASFAGQEAKGGIKCVQSSPNLSSFSSIEEVAMRREIVCDNCERQCPSPVDTKFGIFCSGECQWSAHFNRRDLRKW